MYVFLFVAFLASMVAQKLSLAVASSKIPRENHKDGKRPTKSSELFNVNNQPIYTHPNDMINALCVRFTNVLCMFSQHIYYRMIFFIDIFFCQQTPETEAHSMLLLTAMCIPYIFNFLSSCWKVHFGNEKPPSILTVVLVSISLFHCEYKKIGKTNCYCPFSRQLKSMFKFSVMHVHIKLFDMSYNRQ